jgi:hypothetical protein
MTARADPPAASLVAELAGRLGPAHVLTAEADMEGHLVEARGLYRGAALAVARPRESWLG